MEELSFACGEEVGFPELQTTSRAYVWLISADTRTLQEPLREAVSQPQTPDPQITRGEEAPPLNS